MANEGGPHRIPDDVVVAEPGRSARSRLQSADIIMSDTADRPDGCRPAATLAAYPGCVVAALRDEQGRWCLLAVRHAGTVLVRACREPLDRDTATLLATTCYATRGPGADVLRCLRESSPVPVRARFVRDEHTRAAADEDAGSGPSTASDRRTEERA